MVQEQSGRPRRSSQSEQDLDYDDPVPTVLRPPREGPGLGCLPPWPPEEDEDERSEFSTITVAAAAGGGGGPPPPPPPDPDREDHIFYGEEDDEDDEDDSKYGCGECIKRYYFPSSPDLDIEEQLSKALEELESEDELLFSCECTHYEEEAHSPQYESSRGYLSRYMPE